MRVLHKASVPQNRDCNEEIRATSARYGQVRQVPRRQLEHITTEVKPFGSLRKKTKATLEKNMGWPPTLLIPSGMH